MVAMMLNTKTTNTGMAHTVDQEAQTVSRLTDTDHTVDILSKILSLSSMEKSLKIIKFQLISLNLTWTPTKFTIANGIAVATYHITY